MKKAGYKKLSIAILSGMISISAIAASSSMSHFFQSRNAGIGVHFDVGAQINAGYYSTKYREAEYGNNNNVSELLLDAVPIKTNQGPSFSPTLFAGIRYYYSDKTFIAFHIGDTFIHRTSLNLSYDDYYDSINNAIKAKLTTRNTLYGKFSWGYFVTPDVDLNIGVLSVYDRYRFTYQVDGFDTDNPPTDTGSVQYSHKFGGGGYGFGLGVERYLSDRFIISLNYTLIRHNSINKILINGSRFDDTSPLEIKSDTFSHLNFSDRCENIISLGLVFEI